MTPDDALAHERERRVLHVVESYGGGVASALDQYVRATPDLEHHLLRRVRSGDHVEDGEQTVFATIADLPPSPPAAVLAVRRRAREVDPGVVHAHSSFAGAYTRLGIRRGRRRVVYTAHCFATERLDLGSAARRGYGLVERVLGLNTDVYAGCSAREVDLGRAIAPRRTHVRLVNVTDVVPSGGAERDTITAMGRLGAQHDPRFFADLVADLRDRGIDTPARWVGGGPVALVKLLEDAGVVVTGWVPRSRALELVERSALYVHTGVWDGEPMALLEAVALGVPVLARHSAALDDAPRAWVSDDAGRLAGLAGEVLDRDSAARADNLGSWAEHFADHTVEHQRQCLLAAYGLASRGGLP